MLVLTRVLMDLIIPAIFGQNQDISLNQKMIESMLQQGGIVALLFKLNTIIIAPIIEEISFRGIIFEEAKPLGKLYSSFGQRLFLRQSMGHRHRSNGRFI